MRRENPNNDPSRSNDRSRNHRDNSWDRVKDFITLHSDELRRSVDQGAVAPKLIEAFKEVRIEQKDLVGMIQHGVECSRELGTYCGITTLRDKGVLSLGCLNKLLSNKPGDPERDKFVKSCNVLLSTPETACLGALILSATMYPLYEPGTRRDELREASCLLKRFLEPEAFVGWSNLAAQSLFWSYSSVIADASPSSYIAATQLRSGCFGHLTSSAAKDRALGMLRLFIPEANKSDGIKSLSRTIPMDLWDAFDEVEQKWLLSRIRTDQELLPWAHSVLDAIQLEGKEIQRLCSIFSEYRVAESTADITSHDDNREQISGRFDDACLPAKRSAT